MDKGTRKFILAALRAVAGWAFGLVKRLLPIVLALVIYGAAMGYYGLITVQENTSISTFSQQMNLPDLGGWVFAASAVLAMLYLLFVMVVFAAAYTVCRFLRR